MYITVTQQLLVLGEKSEFKNFKLCYIDEIPETYSDYTPESKKIMESEEYKKWEDDYKKFREEEFKNQGYSTYRWDVCPWYNDIQMKEYPNPERELGTHYAYFTPLELNEQWGDDWDDSPYDCNAGIPYDEVIEETNEADGLRIATKHKEHTILKIPFASKDDYVYPSDYGYNCPFCVKAINNNAVAWIYNEKESIHAGINPYDFVEKLKTF